MYLRTETKKSAPPRRSASNHSVEPRFVQDHPPKAVAIAIGNADEIRKTASALDALTHRTKRTRSLGRAVLRKHWRRFTEMFPNEAERSAIIRQLIQCEARGELPAFISAMSWQALKWADEQLAGDLAASAVLYVRASHADKNGRGFVGVPEIAEKLGTAKTTVIRADERLVEKGLMKWTKERAGQTLSIKVYQLSLPRSSSAALSLQDSKQTRSSSEAVAKQTRSSSAPLSLHDTRARVPRNPEPGTNETVVRSSQNELTVSNNKEDNKNFRPCLSRPKDAGEVWEYIYSGADETEPLSRYFGEHVDDEEADRDIEYWLHMNARQGWRGVTDWHVYLRETFLAGWFPSQKRKAKRRLK